MSELRQAWYVSLVVILAAVVGCDSAGKQTAKKDTKIDGSKSGDSGKSASSSKSTDSAKSAGDADKSTATSATTTSGEDDSPNAGKKVAKPMPPRKARRSAVAKAPAAAGQVDPADLIMPKVLLTDGEAATCLVRVGDAMPEVELNDLEGQPQILSKLRGEKLTVVAFWTANHPYAVEELADLGPAVSDQFDDQGVAVVGINEQNSQAEAQLVVDRVGASFPILLDNQGAALAKVAAKKLPRTYLLDAEGKILWFDMEYSRSTRRDLLRAIRFQLSQR